MINNILNFLVNNRIENFDLIIEYYPNSYNIQIIRMNNESNLFGYSDKNIKEIINTKAIIIFNPDKAFLKGAGIFFETELPIIAFFKESDNVKRGDRVKIEYEDYNKNEYKMLFQVVDTYTIGYLNRYAYRIAPERSEGGSNI